MAHSVEVCTVREAAGAYRVSPATIRRLIAAGKLRAIQVGRSVRIDRRVLDQMLSKEGIR